MILDKLVELNQLGIVLASKSPRRSQILKQIGLEFQVVVSDFEENLDKTKYTPEDYVVANATIKASSVAKMLREQHISPFPKIIIGCDTVVVYDNKIVEKPKFKDHAYEMLKSFSNNIHHVISGVAIIINGEEESKQVIHTFYERTEVQFDNLSDSIIHSYVETGEPMDKAGGYGIQGIGGCLITGIRGCYYNVMGFPLNHFCRTLVSLYPQLF
ncbi:hypothetical protein WA158_005621 [Blastocystis sp. Blastoise]